jgi:hypothetical protein
LKIELIAADDPCLTRNCGKSTLWAEYATELQRRLRRASEMTKSSDDPTKHNLMTSAAVPLKRTKPSVADINAAAIRKPA